MSYQFAINVLCISSMTCMFLMYTYADIIHLLSSSGYLQGGCLLRYPLVGYVAKLDILFAFKNMLGAEKIFFVTQLDSFQVQSGVFQWLVTWQTWNTYIY